MANVKGYISMFLLSKYLYKNMKSPQSSWIYKNIHIISACGSPFNTQFWNYLCFLKQTNKRFLLMKQPFIPILFQQQTEYKYIFMGGAHSAEVVTIRLLTYTG